MLFRLLYEEPSNYLILKFGRYNIRKKTHLEKLLGGGAPAPSAPPVATALDVDQNRKLCVNGDFNATTSITKRHSCYNGRNNSNYEDDVSNINGELFLEFCNLKKLSILNTWFDHPLEHRITWHSPDQNTKNVIDYSLSDSWLRQFVTDV